MLIQVSSTCQSDDVSESLGVSTAKQGRWCGHPKQRQAVNSVLVVQSNTSGFLVGITFKWVIVICHALRQSKTLAHNK